MSMIYSADAFKPMLKYNENIYLYICQKKTTLAGGILLENTKKNCLISSRSQRKLI